MNPWVSIELLDLVRQGKMLIGEGAESIFIGGDVSTSASVQPIVMHLP